MKLRLDHCWQSSWVCLATLGLACASAQQQPPALPEPTTASAETEPKTERQPEPAADETDTTAQDQPGGLPAGQERPGTRPGTAAEHRVAPGSEESSLEDTESLAEADAPDMGTASVPSQGAGLTGSTSVPPSQAGVGSTGAPVGPQTPDEQQAELDQKLRESLSEFDELLLEEQRVAAAERVAAGAAQVEGDGNYGGGMGGAGSSGEGGFEPSTAAGGDTSASPGGEEAAEAAPASGPAGGSVGGGSGGRIPPDVGDGSDDDVVARQLREAAMKEEDPELREKLWQEYRDYKKASKK